MEAKALSEVLRIMPLIMSIAVCCTGIILFTVTVYVTKTLLNLQIIKEKNNDLYNHKFFYIDNNNSSYSNDNNDQKE